MRAVLLGVSLVLTLSSCASAPRWQHSSLTGAEADRQYLVDNGECTRESYGAAPPRPPAVPAVVVVPSPYPPASNQPAQPVQPIYPDYAGDGMRAAAAGAADRARSDIYAGCMAQRGWMRSR